MKASPGELIATGAFGAIAGALAYRLWQSSQPTVAATSPSLPSSPPLPASPGLQQTSGGGIFITVQPNVATQNVALDVQTAVIVALPTGGKWNSMDGAPISDTTSPQAFVFQGPISHDFVWFDAANVQHESILNFSVGPTVPTVTT